jgi:Flp pilus assembly protein TadD
MPRLAYLAVLSLGVTASISAQTSQESLARALIQRDNVEEAREVLADCHRRDPDNVNVRYQLGYVLYRQRRLEAAKSEFEAVVKLAPPALYSRYFLGRIALLENHPAQAAVWLDSPAHADPPVMDAHTIREGLSRIRRVRKGRGNLPDAHPPGALGRGAALSTGARLSAIGPNGAGAR